METGKSECLIELLSDSRECEGLLLCHWWRGKQPGSWGKCCSQGWLAVSQLPAGAALVWYHAGAGVFYCMERLISPSRASW